MFIKNHQPVNHSFSKQNGWALNVTYQKIQQFLEQTKASQSICFYDCFMSVETKHLEITFLTHRVQHQKGQLNLFHL